MRQKEQHEGTPSSFLGKHMMGNCVCVRERDRQTHREMADVRVECRQYGASSISSGALTQPRQWPLYHFHGLRRNLQFGKTQEPRPRSLPLNAEPSPDPSLHRAFQARIRSPACREEQQERDRTKSRCKSPESKDLVGFQGTRSLSRLLPLQPWCKGATRAPGGHRQHGNSTCC